MPNLVATKLRHKNLKLQKTNIHKTTWFRCHSIRTCIGLTGILQLKQWLDDLIKWIELMLPELVLLAEDHSPWFAHKVTDAHQMSVAAYLDVMTLSNHSDISTFTQTHNHY